MTPEPDRSRDTAGGLLLLAIGLGAVALGRSYPMGSAGRPGAGVFPVGLGGIMALIGLALVATARRLPGGAGGRTGPEWRGWLCIAGGIVAFVELGRHGGLVPATLGVVFISALGHRGNSLRDAALLAAGMLAVCLLVFWWALGIQFPLFAWGNT